VDEERGRTREPVGGEGEGSVDQLREEIIDVTDCGGECLGEKGYQLLVNINDSKHQI